MQDDTFKVTGYGTYTDDGGSHQTVQFDYQVWGVQHSTEMFIDKGYLADTSGTPTPNADQLSAALQSWVVNEAKPQLDPNANQVPADLQALVQG